MPPINKTMLPPSEVPAFIRLEKVLNSQAQSFIGRRLDIVEIHHLAHEYLDVFYHGMEVTVTIAQTLRHSPELCQDWLLQYLIDKDY